MSALKRWSETASLPLEFKVWKTGQSETEAIPLTDALNRIFPIVNFTNTITNQSFACLVHLTCFCPLVPFVMQFEHRIGTQPSEAFKVVDLLIGSQLLFLVPLVL
ncbi:zinc finger CCCH domain-containing protein 44 isoform X1 [Spatholobus suberectus]|nr:zinc finger CCCH domain-containing protein 44 isoform X1 [Spatholobus suberectus]